MALPLLHTPEQAAQWLRERIGAATTAALRADSRQVHTGDGFIAWPGAASDGRQYVAQALAQGAAACLVEADGVEKFGLENTTLNRHALACYPKLKADTGAIAAAFYQHPSHTLDVVAFTGTNGKTSSAWWLAQALSALPDAQALPCGLIGTLGIGRPPMGSTSAHAAAPTPANASTIAAGDLVSSGMTTPDPVLLQHSLRRFADAGLRACAIEASSIGIEEQRLSGTRVRVAVLTNFTQDHLDYHANMDAYWQAKQRLFGWDGLRAAVLNIDDAKGAELAAELATQLAAQLTTPNQRTPLDVWTTSCHDPRARLHARALGYGATGLHFEVVEGTQVLPVQTQLIGSYNAANLLGVMAAMRSLGVPLAQVVAVCQGLQAVPGRMECIAAPNQPLVAVDYAHTPDALQQALAALRPMVQARGGKLWCVFGCGGDRDSSKRPLMGAIAAQLADHVIITSDNPRSESPEAIMTQIMGGITPNTTTGTNAAAHVQVQSDRALAIAHSIAQADARDVVLLAGKGHESTQDIAGVKTPFSDRTHAEHALQARTPMFQLHTALPWLSGATLVGDGLTAVQRVHTDTRTLTRGDLFVALRGERFDANTLLHEAQARGAAAVLCNAGLDAALLPAGMPRIEVADTGAALCELAQHWRAQFQIPLIAVTGSNGKTTVTQMVAAILQAYAPDGGALATQGNFNNAIGVPLTLLRLRATHRIAVVELGMNHPGEIALLAAMAQPTVALVNNAQREHMEFMHTVQAVAEENGNVIRALGEAGTAVFPADDSYTPLWENFAQTPTSARRVARFALQADASADASTPIPTQPHDLICQSAAWQGDAWQVRAEGMGVSLQFALHIAGRHNVKNALAAAACALSAGVPRAAVERGLEAFVPVKGRSRARLLAVQGRSHTLVDDSYNANPDSVRAAIDVLAQLPAPRLLVLGDMGEVGEQGPAFHQEAGQYAHALGIEHVFGFGTLCQMAVAACPGARHFASIEALNAAVLQALPQCNSVLVKGSRSMRMERVVQALEAHAADLQNKGTLCS